MIPTTMATTTGDHYRGRRYLKHAFVLFALLLTYIAVALCAFRSSLSHQEPLTVTRPRPAVVDHDDNTSLSAGTSSTREDNNDSLVAVSSSEGKEIDNLLAFPKNAQVSLQPSPGVAWLMSFGGSGTSYTISNVETCTRTTTASNYAEDFDYCVGILPTQSSSPPCLHKPHKLRLPGSYILTKTHCGGYCMDCAPSAYVHATVESFEEACRTAKLPGNSTTMTQITYDASLVERAIHMIRNPFDNLVGRMHLGRKRRQRQGLDDANLYEDTPEGLAAWCRQLDQHFLERERKSPLLPQGFVEKYATVPCHAEWFRLAQWHTRAMQVMAQRELPVHVLYYENYTTNFDATVTELLDFLQLDALHPPLPFHPGKSYAHLFHKEHVKAATQLVQDVASEEAWNLLKHYFEVPQKVETKSSDADSILETSDLPSIGLLMSFPNSGTSYTIANTEKVSQRTTASNYGIGLYTHPDLPNGPFLHREHMPLPSKFMLTKTHCMGYCDDCHPKNFVIPSTEAFLQGCLTGEQMVNETRTKFTYEASLVSRAIHLFRSPFDNLVARMHLAVKRRRDKLGWSEEDLAKFSHSREGHLRWCTYVDSRHGNAFLQGSYVSEEVLRLMEHLPCALDWYRWVQWHNRAIEVTKEQKLPVHYLYYENYSLSYNQTLDGLLNFLDLTRVDEPLLFHSGKTYLDLYSQDEVFAATNLVQALASPECWDFVKRYFFTINEQEVSW